MISSAPPAAEHIRAWKQSGRSWLGITNIFIPDFEAGAPDAVAKVYAHWAGSVGFTHPLMDGAIVDEFGGGDDPAYDAYRAAVEKLRAEIGEDADLWLRPVEAVRLVDQVMHLKVPNKFFSDGIKDRFQKRLVSIFKDITGLDIGIDYAVCLDLNKHLPPTDPIPPTASQSEFPLSGFNPRYTFASFVVGKSNRLAFATAEVYARAAEARERAEAAGVSWGVNVLVGHPGETTATMDESLAFLDRLFPPGRASRGWLSVDPFRLYPGSRVHREAAEWTAEHGTRFHTPEWWLRAADRDVTSELVDPSAELDAFARLDAAYGRHRATVLREFPAPGGTPDLPLGEGPFV